MKYVQAAETAMRKAAEFQENLEPPSFDYWIN
jgi:hypothetical protein